MTLVLDASPFKIYVQSQKAGWVMPVKASSVICPDLVMDDTLKAEAILTCTDPSECVPQLQITSVISGQIDITYDNGYEAKVISDVWHTVKRGSSPSSLLFKADFTMRCPVDTVFYCIFPQPPILLCYRRKTVFLAEGGQLTITAKPFTQHLWVADGSIAGHKSPALLTIQPNEERVLQSASGMLGCLLWHESR